MNKTLSALILVLFFLPTVSFGASFIAGCEPSFAFSPLTGERCSDLPFGCEEGYLYNVTTGERCIDFSSQEEYNNQMNDEETVEETPTGETPEPTQSLPKWGGAEA